MYNQASSHCVLPTFQELVSGTMCGVHVEKHVRCSPKLYEVYSSPSSPSFSCDGKHVDSQSKYSPNDQSSGIYQRIFELERRMNEQSIELSRLLTENAILRSRKIVKPTTCREKLSKIASRGKSMTLVNETSFIKMSDSPVRDLEEFIAKWNGKQYVIINVFKNRDEIMNYFGPLYQQKFPNMEFKIVLQREQYKQLFKENQHIKTLEKKQAWRVSLYTLDFYNFVKNHVRL